MLTILVIYEEKELKISSHQTKLLFTTDSKSYYVQKVPVHTDTLTKASNSIDDLNKRGEIQNEQHYRKAPDKFQT